MIIYNQYLWNNRYITINNSSFLWRRWKDAGINQICDIYINNDFLTIEEFATKYDITVNFLELLQIRQSLPFAWRTVLRNHVGAVKIFDDMMFPENKELKLLIKSDAKKIYSHFNNKNLHQPTCLQKWQTIYPTIDESLWKHIFKLSFKIVRETRLQSFQYRVLHRTITCRKKLHEMRLTENPNCTVCNKVDDLPHFLIHCNYVKTFWNSLFSWLESNLNHTVDVTESEILFGILGTNQETTVLNYIILHAKHFIHKLRIQEIHTLYIVSFKAHLKYKLTLEKMISENNIPDSFSKFQVLFDSL